MSRKVSEEWREGVIAPIYKKRDPDRIENYRVTLLCTAYKLYADALTERLRAEVEEKSALSQAEFRRKRRTIDNI